MVLMWWGRGEVRHGVREISRVQQHQESLGAVGKSGGRGIWACPPPALVRPFLPAQPHHSGSLLISNIAPLACFISSWASLGISRRSVSPASDGVGEVGGQEAAGVEVHMRSGGFKIQCDAGNQDQVGVVSDLQRPPPSLISFAPSHLRSTMGRGRCRSGQTST